MTAPPLRILYTTAEHHPSYRPDVRILFGTALAPVGVSVDLLAVVDRHALESPTWTAGRALLRRGSGRFGVMLTDVFQQLSLFLLCFRGYDALVVRDKPILGVIGWLAARLARIPYCYWMSYPLPENYLWLAQQPGCGRARGLYMRARGHLGRICLRRLLVPHCDWLFAQSDAMVSALRRDGLTHDRVTPVPMGVDMDMIPPPAAGLPLALTGCRLAVYLGTLDRYRRPELLVDTALRVAESYPDFKLLIIGEADEPGDRGWLRAYAESIGASECVYFAGRVPYSEGLALVQHAEIGLSPVPRTALTEVGSPTKAVEYLACGLPVVCNDQPDQALVVRESGGGLIASFDADSFAAAIMSLLADPADAKSRGQAGRLWVRRHRSYRTLGVLVGAQLRDIAKRPAAWRASAGTDS
jgi:glycosyltransferase involved in cell wall biosynthesis